MRLEAQITIRLLPYLDNRLRELAEEKNERYTAMLRRWIEERANWDEASATFTWTQDGEAISAPWSVSGGRIVAVALTPGDPDEN